MDPNEALRRLREILYAEAEDIENISDDEAEDIENISDDEVMGLMSEVSTIFLGLDEWIQKGGFLPKEWKDAQGAAKAKDPT